MKISINGVDISYDDHGIGLPVLFLHAFPLNRSMWTELMTALLSEQRYRLVACDYRGFGESSLSNGILTMETVADDIVALMDALGMKQAVLCGLSMGGYVAFAMLRKYPQRIAGLIFADTKPAADTEEGKINRERLAELALTRGTQAVADLQIPRLLAERTRRQQPEVEVRVRQLIAANTVQAIAAASRGMAEREDASDLLAQIVCPTLVIVGEQDLVTPPDLVQRYVEHIPKAQCVVLAQSGHLTCLEQPEAFLAQVRAFLQQNF
ncbi:alpha/beta fold hydrolase [Tengunoibacter tsumagoiensis]|uniref:Alpha/beta hydrolase n=1 Tax=Tengunoibacter tsumagoiensis TaxID=2014871 RepID=A0A402A2N6_9CHLR|nr:alpha/beta fold hydrolase [Tengunoibacter tsumagoiensis]GCE13332.1 alpha/beta hydrolase [Tengunoibacter tsumagoiensis]